MNPARFLIAVVSGALVACAPMQWEKPAPDPGVLEADLGECRQVGALAASRQSYPPLLFPGRDIRGSPFFYQPYRDRADLFYLEQSFFESCMQERGYRRVPAEPAHRDEPGRLKDDAKDR